jgi:hypothetical protein
MFTHLATCDMEYGNATILLHFHMYRKAHGSTAIIPVKDLIWVTPEQATPERDISRWKIVEISLTGRQG